MDDHRFDKIRDLVALMRSLERGDLEAADHVVRTIDDPVAFVMCHAGITAGLLAHFCSAEGITREDAYTRWLTLADEEDRK